MKYFDQYKKIHATKKYGFTGAKYIDNVVNVIPKDIDSVLDFGAGQSDLAWLIKKRTGIEDVAAYDPCVEGRDVKPDRTFDFVTCTDVLEHVPEEELEGVLDDISFYGKKGALLVICTVPAGEILPNGENAHCTVHDRDWWEEKLREFWFNIEHVPSMSNKHRLVAFLVS